MRSIVLVPFILILSLPTLAEPLCQNTTTKLIIVGENHTPNWIQYIWLLGDPSASGREYTFSEAVRGRWPFLSELVVEDALSDTSAEWSARNTAEFYKIPPEQIDTSRIRSLESEGYALARLYYPLVDETDQIRLWLQNTIPYFQREILGGMLQTAVRYAFAREAYFEFLTEIAAKYPAEQTFRVRMDQLTKVLVAQWQLEDKADFTTNFSSELKDIGFSLREIKFIIYRLHENAVQLANSKYPDLKLISAYGNSHAKSEAQLTSKVLIAMRDKAFAKRIQSSLCYEFKNEPVIVAYMGAAHLAGVSKHLNDAGFSNFETFNLYGDNASDKLIVILPRK